MDHEDSDYGSDIDLDDPDILEFLTSADAATTRIETFFGTTATTTTTTTTLATTRNGNAQLRESVVESATSGRIRYPVLPTDADLVVEREDGPSVKLEYVAPEVTDPSVEPTANTDPTSVEPEGDTRSPYERYRSRKKALSVTDLVSGIWCEQQFEYNLKQGFKTRTPQMKKGTNVHRILEEQVHTVVEVRNITTPEDKWGLKLFNMYQGLCGLVDTGLTRELPVFGFIDDVFVQGVIDEITYVNPMERLTAMATTTTAKGKPRKRVKFEPESGQLERSTEHLNVVPKKGLRTTYVSDTKTRASKTAPSASQQRGTLFQLMLYRSLLLHMRDNAFDFARFLDWFGLNGAQPFSDGFIAEMCEIGDLDLEELLANNSLWGIWDLVQGKLEECVEGVGEEMGVSYRSQSGGELIRFQVVRYEEEKLRRHVERTMEWWKGGRETVGVEIEEAWKCRMCEFADRCTWRLGKIEELTNRRTRMASTLR